MKLRDVDVEQSRKVGAQAVVHAGAVVARPSARTKEAREDDAGFMDDNMVRVYCMIS